MRDFSIFKNTDIRKEISERSHSRSIALFTTLFIFIGFIIQPEVSGRDVTVRNMQVVVN